MALRLLVRRGGGVLATSSRRQMARAGGGHHGPPMPPFARLREPDYPLDENHDLVWEDGVAPETCIDFDAPNVSTAEACAWLLGGLGGFAGLFGLVSLSDPEGQRDFMPRTHTLPPTAYDPRDLWEDVEDSKKHKVL